MYNYTPVEINKVHNGEQRVYKFDNGYGASVIRHQYSYGGDKGLWELAVLKNGELLDQYRYGLLKSEVK